MAKLQRKTQKIFAGNTTSDQITAFGTAKTTSPVYTSDVNAIQTDVYTGGWTPSLISDLAPYLQDSNALHYVETYQLAYLMQQGIPEWDANTEYSMNSICKQNDNLYISLQNENINHEITETSYWKVFGDTDSKILNMLKTLYPVGSIYLTTATTCPLSLLMPNTTWQLVSSGKALWTGNGSNGGTTIPAGLPNIIGDVAIDTQTENQSTTGAFYKSKSELVVGVNGKWNKTGLGFDASRSNSIYGNSTTIQPPAYVINTFRRTS